MFLVYCGILGKRKEQTVSRLPMHLCNEILSSQTKELYTYLGWVVESAYVKRRGTLQCPYIQSSNHE